MLGRMPLVDAPLAELEHRVPTVVAPDDLDEFWARTLATARLTSGPAVIERVDNRLTAVDTFDVTFPGFAGDPVKGWLHLPAGKATGLPGIVLYHGYGRGRGLSIEVPLHALAGYAVLTMDIRGQGAHGSPGHTPDPHGSGPSHPGFTTRGLDSPDNHYYRRVYTDAVLAVDVLRQHPSVAGDVVVMGASQGGAIAIAAAALADGVRGVAAGVPFMCDVPRALDIATEHPYTEIVAYLTAHPDQVATALRTLSYLDGAVLASRIHVPALFSVGLMDPVCPPSTVYAAYNRLRGPRRIDVYRFAEHGGPWGAYHLQVQLEWLDELARTPGNPIPGH